MGKKRIKISKGVSEFTPTSMNFSTLERRVKEGDLEFDPSDNSLEKKRIEDALEFEEMVIQILCNLDGREKMVFLFQLLRDNGYQIDHGSFAKVVKLSRRQYMRVLEDVRLKSALFVIGYNESKSHK